MNTDDLKFDKMEVDTKLAKEFLQLNPDIQNRDIGTECIEIFSEINNISEKLTHLSELIIENKQLFCQLEYLIRNIPTREIEEYDLKLLVNNILYWREHRGEINYINPVIKMCEDTPCVMLGCIAQIYVALSNNYFPIIEASEKTFAISYLFSQLCAKAGFPKVPVYSQSVNIPGLDLNTTIEFNKIKEFDYGCVGIITSRSDVDSAVTAFLEAPKRKPWAVRQILIEESAVEDFKRVISWKARGREEVDGLIASQCSQSYSYNGRLFLLEYVGDSCTDAVLVNTYRTVKELLSLVPQCFAVSLWASDISEANEIALKLNTNIWINCFGNFSGPVQTSQAFFSLCQPMIHVKPSVQIKSVMKQQVAWAKLNILERIRTVKKCLNILEYKPDLQDFVHVGDTFMCCGIAVPVGLVYLCSHETFGDIVKNLCIGNAVMVSVAPSELFEQIRKLREAGAPVDCEACVSTSSGCKVGFGEFYRTKVIWTTYGTIFAN